MSDNQSNLTDKEMEDLQNIVADILASVCAMADKHNIDRDSMLKYLADMLTTFVEVATIQNYETRHTNADRIRNMSDEELAEFIEQISTDSMETISFGTKEYKEIWERKETALEWLQSEVEEDYQLDDLKEETEAE